MATPQASDVVVAPGVRVVTWQNIANGEQGTWVDVGVYTDISFAVHGTFGTGGKITVQGTNDLAASPAAASILALPDSTDTIIDQGSARFLQVLTAPNRIRPAVTAGDGTTSLTMRMRLTRGT